MAHQQIYIKGWNLLPTTTASIPGTNHSHKTRHDYLNGLMVYAVILKLLASILSAGNPAIGTFPYNVLIYRPYCPYRPNPHSKAKKSWTVKIDYRPTYRPTVQLGQ